MRQVAPPQTIYFAPRLHQDATSFLRPPNLSQLWPRHSSGCKFGCSKPRALTARSVPILIANSSMACHIQWWCALAVVFCALATRKPHVSRQCSVIIHTATLCVNINLHASRLNVWPFRKCVSAFHRWAQVATPSVSADIVAMTVGMASIAQWRRGSLISGGTTFNHQWRSCCVLVQVAMRISIYRYVLRLVDGCICKATLY